MKKERAYKAVLLLLLFSCYYCGISMFSHAHILNGSSIVHSHFGGASDHEHDDSQYAVIDVLSQFQTEYASESCCIIDSCQTNSREEKRNNLKGKDCIFLYLCTP